MSPDTVACARAEQECVGPGPLPRVAYACAGTRRTRHALTFRLLPPCPAQLPSPRPPHALAPPLAHSRVVHRDYATRTHARTNPTTHRPPDPPWWKPAQVLLLRLVAEGLRSRKVVNTRGKRAHSTGNDSPTVAALLMHSLRLGRFFSCSKRSCVRLCDARKGLIAHRTLGSAAHPRAFNAASPTKRNRHPRPHSHKEKMDTDDVVHVPPPPEHGSTRAL
jgi:hypothetical protein